MFPVSGLCANGMSTYNLGDVNQPGRPLIVVGGVVGLALVLSTGCRPRSAPGSDGAAQQTVVPHGDHRPRHGGLVLMNGDLHLEVVFDPAGRHRVYFSDAVRAELPASYASEVKMVVMRKNAPPETLMLQVDDTAESWVASGAPITDHEAEIRVAYVAGGTPYFIDLPFSYK